MSIIFYIATCHQQTENDVAELKNLDQDLLFDALKHEDFQNQEEFDEDDKAFMRGISKGRIY